MPKVTIEGRKWRVRRLITWLSIATCIGGMFQACHSQPTVTSNEASDEQFISDFERQKRTQGIRDYFGERTKHRTIIKTTRTRSGQIIDWIKPATQVDGGVLAMPPEVMSKQDAPARPLNRYLEMDAGIKQSESQPNFELQLDEGTRGPAGTVPIVRFDVERYLESIKIPPKDPRDVLKKIPPPAPDSNQRYYAVWQRFGTFYGTAGRINIWNTDGPVENETSIAQTAVIRGNPMQAIEAGKIEVQSLNGNRDPHFFTYFRTNGTASGDWIAGYNTLVDGWIQYSPRVAPGMALNAWNSTQNGNQYSLDIEVRLHQGNWWVWVAGEWAGYYPYCIGGGAQPCSRGTLFSTSGIRDSADRLDWYGEVYDSSAPSATSTDMGSGQLASTGWQHAGYFRNLTYFWAPATYWWWDSGSVSVTDAACYDANGPFYSADASWRNWFFYGGPGKEATACR